MFSKHNTGYHKVHRNPQIIYWYIGAFWCLWLFQFVKHYMHWVCLLHEFVSGIDFTSTSVFWTSWLTDLLPPGIALIFVLLSNLVLGNFSILALEHRILSFIMLAGFSRYQIKNCWLSLMILSFVPCYQWAWPQSSQESSEVQLCEVLKWLCSLTISKSLSKLSCSLLG